MESKQLVDRVYQFQPQMLSALEALVKLESPSGHKAVLEPVASHLTRRFQALNAEVSRMPSPEQGDNLRVVFPAAEATQARPGLLLCHYDTVHPEGTLSRQPFQVLDGRAYGPGTLDMKAGIVMVEFALRALIDLGLPLPRPVVVLITSDEEIGSPSSRPLIEEEARGAEYVLVLEPPAGDGALKTARKGVGRFTLEVHGRAAHAGTQPEKGVSANHELAHQILIIQRLNDPGKGTTVNVGVVRGGTRRNVIAASAEAELDVRAWTQEEEARIERALRELTPVHPEAQIRVDGGFDRPPMARSPAIAALYQRARLVGEQLGLDLKESATGGGSDANFTAALGVPTLDGLGAPGDGAHADHEHITLRPWPMRTALLAELLLAL
jgi:glutamate carboxypeptidase